MEFMLVINKNRGWRGLAEAKIMSDEGDTIKRSIFSFSEAMWRDLLEGHLAIKDKDDITIIDLKDTTDLPKPTQQRSVLIKSFITTIANMRHYKYIDVLNDFRKGQLMMMKSPDARILNNFMKNNNNHTQSEWNAIGLRVAPFINI